MTAFRTLDDLEVWTASQELAIEVYRLIGTKTVRTDHAYIDQIRRAVISISSNIAEGFGRHSDTEFARFLDIARGSAQETISLFRIGFGLEYLDAGSLRRLEDEASHIVAQLTSLSVYLRRTRRTPITDQDS